MKILITGIHGFVGSNFITSLNDKFSIYGLDIISPEKEGVIKTYSWKDIQNENIELPSFDAIIHLAGKAHDTKNMSSAEDYFRINTGLTEIIYNYFLKSSATKFIFFSSVKAAADFVSGDVLTEDIIPAPKGPYGESKIKAENYILGKLPKDKSVYILRPCMIHGPGNKGNLNLLYNVVSKGIPWPLGKFENRRTFTSIGNLCYVIQNLLEKEIETGIYNIGDDESVSTNELVKVICEVLDKKSHIWYLPKKAIVCLAKFGTILKLPLNTERLTKLTENYEVSNCKIKAVLNIQKMPIRALDGLKITLLSFRKNK